MITRGDIVRIRPEWQDPGDASYVWTAVDDEEKGRVSIQCGLGLTYNPIATVLVDMLEPVHVATERHEASGLTICVSRARDGFNVTFRDDDSGEYMSDAHLGFDTVESAIIGAWKVLAPRPLSVRV